MNTHNKRSSKDRRQAGQARMAALIESRGQTLSLYADLAAHRPYHKTPQLTAELHRFCQVLIDYTASAHFQLYHKIAEGRENRSPVATAAEQLYPSIAESTDLILAFNDDFGEDLDQDYERLEARLSELGEILANRIELEDKMILALQHDRREPMAAQA